MSPEAFPRVAALARLIKADGETTPASTATPPVGAGVSPLRIVVYGTPASQGSKRHVGNGVMIESSAKTLKPWREAVKLAALEQHGQTHETFLGPVSVRITFSLRRPQSHYRSGHSTHLLRPSAPTFPAVKPDLDKCVRAVLDALTDAGTWRDDSQVVHIDAAKLYVSHSVPALQMPGATIDIVPERGRL